MASYEITSKIQTRAAAAGITLDDIRARYGSEIHGGVEVMMYGSHNFDTLMAWIASAEAAAKAPATPARRHTETRSWAYGRGRRYADQSGATQYDRGNGRYDVQIWDEA